MYLATLAVVAFIFEHKNIGYVPLCVSVVAYLGGTLNILKVYGIISLTIYKLFVSLVFVGVGVSVLCYAAIISKKNTKENSYE